MASGYSILNSLNKQTKEKLADTEPRANFQTKSISVFKIYRNELNFYQVADIEGLAADIRAHGLKQNLEVVQKPCEKGEYKLISGERRWLALKLLAAEGAKEFEFAACRVIAPGSEEEEQIEIISANAYRVKGVNELIEEERRLKNSLERLKAAGKQIAGYELQAGRIRDIVASKMGLSKTKVAQPMSFS